MLTRKRFSRNIIILSIAPLVVVLAFALSCLLFLPQIIGDRQSQKFDDYLMDVRTSELQTALSLAKEAIGPARKHARANDLALQEVARILTDLEYGEDGYFFVYDYHGLNIAHPRQPYRVGRNWIDFQDVNGKYVIRDLIDVARKGGGQYRYHWEKPSTQETREKLSAVIALEDLGWIVGTGVYVDDITEQTAGLSKTVETTLRNGLITLAVSTFFLHHHNHANLLDTEFPAVPTGRRESPRA